MDLAPATVSFIQDLGKVNTVNPTVGDNDHLYYQDLLGAAALGALPLDEQALLRAHLEVCASCRAEFADLRAVASLLPLTLDERRPSPGLRYRIQSAIQAELDNAPAETIVPPETLPPRQQQEHLPPPAPISIDRSRRRSPLRPTWLLSTAALVLLAIAAGFGIGAYLFDPTEDDITPVETAVPGETIAVAFTTPVPDASGQLTYLPDEEVFLLSVENLPPAPANSVYQVWLIGSGAPEPVGVIDDDTGELAVAADRAAYQLLAVTVEPGPLGSPAPTSSIILTADLTDAAAS